RSASLFFAPTRRRLLRSACAVSSSRTALRLKRVTSDHRVAGSSPAGCKSSRGDDSQTILGFRNERFLPTHCPNFALIQKKHFPTLERPGSHQTSFRRANRQWAGHRLGASSLVQ